MIVIGVEAHLNQAFKEATAESVAQCNAIFQSEGGRHSIDAVVYSRDNHPKDRIIS